MNTSITERCYEIMNGPSRDTLFDACKYAYAENANVAIDFVVATGYTMPKGHPGRAYIPMRLTDIVVAGIEHEDGSGESFNLHGYCRADLRISGSTTYSNYYFRSYYNVKSRTGTINFYKSGSYESE